MTAIAPTAARAARAHLPLSKDMRDMPMNEADVAIDWRPDSAAGRVAREYQRRSEGPLGVGSPVRAERLRLAQGGVGRLRHHPCARRKQHGWPRSTP